MTLSLQAAKLILWVAPAASRSLLRETPDAILGIKPAIVSRKVMNAMKAGEAAACSSMDFPVATSAAAAPAKAIMAILPFVRCSQRSCVTPNPACCKSSMIHTCITGLRKVWHCAGIASAVWLSQHCGAAQPTSGAGPVKAIASSNVSQSSSKGITPSLLTSIVGSLLLLSAALTLEVQFRIGGSLPKGACPLPLRGDVHGRETCSMAL